MSAPPSGFEMTQEGDTLIVIPLGDLSEWAYLEAGAEQVLDRASDPSVRNVVLDFHRTDYFASSALGFFMRLSKRVCTRKGRMALCNVSAHEREILQFTRMDHLWPICPSRQEALRAVREEPRPGEPPAPC
jgi:stage II sporulation protein AA (anti-sigma F factor antagonist)